jgi:uncharacterized membrane protein YgcG
MSNEANTESTADEIQESADVEQTEKEKVLFTPMLMSCLEFHLLNNACWNWLLSSMIYETLVCVCTTGETVLKYIMLVKVNYSESVGYVNI